MREFECLGQLLRQAREEQNLTQKQLSERLHDVHIQFISNWERGLCAPPAHSFDRLFKILKLKKTAVVEIMMQDERVRIEKQVFQKRAS